MTLVVKAKKSTHPLVVTHIYFSGKLVMGEVGLIPNKFDLSLIFDKSDRQSCIYLGCERRKKSVRCRVIGVGKDRRDEALCSIRI